MAAPVGATEMGKADGIREGRGLSPVRLRTANAEGCAAAAHSVRVQHVADRGRHCSRHFGGDVQLTTVLQENSRPRRVRLVELFQELDDAIPGFIPDYPEMSLL